MLMTVCGLLDVFMKTNR